MLKREACESIHISPFIEGIKDQIEDGKIEDQKDEA